MSTSLDLFRTEYVQAHTWAQRKDGPPLYLLDRLSPEELKTAERELIIAASVSDTWPVAGLAYIRSEAALPKLYEMLKHSSKGTRVTIAHAIFRICGDPDMIDVVLEEISRVTASHELIEILYLLPGFEDERIAKLLDGYRDHSEYLVAYNATRAMGLSTDEVVEKFRKR